MSLEIGSIISYNGQPAEVVGDEYGVPVIDMLPNINDAIQESIGQDALKFAVEDNSSDTEG